tara:strand:- start:266 stop:577 length:312 start_codon:yes stop_codon:yes gene_type:complete
MDICFKFAVLNIEFNHISGFWSAFKKVLSRKWFWFAIGVSVLNFWLWVNVLSYYDLSFAYPLFGICFAFIMLSGRWFFGESLDKYKIIGIMFILLSSLILVLE